MNERPTLLKPVGPASLADEADFRLGDILVQPSIREVRAGDVREIVEPRVMQVFVALARADGAVVSRDELIRQCWGGRIVGEDAINRCVSKVRQLAELGGSKAFDIETIPRVGYRLRHRETSAALPAAFGSTPAPSDGPFASATLSGASAIAQNAPVRGAAAPAGSVANPRLWRWIAFAVAGIAVAAAGIAGLIFWLRPAPQWIVAESHLPFISTPLIERYPALAPDGTMLAYSAGPGIHDRQIYLRLLKEDDPIQLTHDTYDASAPAWSPDGKTIAYVVFRDGHPCRIMEVLVPAGQSRQVGQCRVNLRSSLAFDVSGRALFFSDASAPGTATRIFKLDLESGNLSAVTTPGNAAFSDDSPSISPDGKALLYQRTLNGPKIQIRSLSLSSGADRLVAAFNDGDADAAWSADGSAIFLSRSSSNDNALWAYPAAGGGAPWRVLSASEYLGRVSTGPNGLVAIETQYAGGELVAVTPHSDSPPKPIDSGGLRTWCVDYAPDGTFLATAWQSGTFGVWISGVNGSFRELLRLPDSNACAIRWSPDSTRFAFVQWTSHGFDIPVMTRAGAPIARLHFDEPNSGLLDWTADGRSLLTSRKEKRGWRIWRTDLAAPDKSVPITAYGWFSPRVHGSMLFAEKDGVAGVWRIDGTPVRLTDGPTPDASDVYNIAGDRLIYSDMSDPDHPMFSAVSVNGGPKDRLAPLPHGQIDFTFGVDPRSGDIVYTRDTQDTDIGLLRLVKR